MLAALPVRFLVIASVLYPFVCVGCAASPPARLPDEIRVTETFVGRGFAGSSVNMIAGAQHTLLTHGTHQYAAFYDPDGRLMLARRSGDHWTVSGTPYLGRVVDAHNTIALGIDGMGYVHVAWNHHNSPLTYARSVAPGSLELGPLRGMTGALEGSVTYPAFLSLPDGDLLFFHRDGGSGRGNLVLSRYDVRRDAWVRVHDNLVSGEGRRSAYVSTFIDASGTLHAAWTWRETPDVATNHDLCYARSNDAGRTWTTSGGARLQIPITAATAEYVVRIPEGSSLMNPPSISADTEGLPVIANYWCPPGSRIPQYQVAWKGEGEWRVRQVTQRVEPFSLSGTATKRPPLSRAVLVARTASTGAREAHVIFRDDATGGRAVAWSCADLEEGAWTRVLLTEDGLGAWEPSYDPVAWRKKGELHLLVQRVQQRDGDDAAASDEPPTPVRVLVWKPDAPPGGPRLREN